jgi:hypothetical protein
MQDLRCNIAEISVNWIFKLKFHICKPLRFKDELLFRNFPHFFLLQEN